MKPQTKTKLYDDSCKIKLHVYDFHYKKKHSLEAVENTLTDNEK